LIMKKHKLNPDDAEAYYKKGLAFDYFGKFE
jgi:hypothetical protein